MDGICNLHARILRARMPTCLPVTARRGLIANMHCVVDLRLMTVPSPRAPGSKADF